MSTLHERLAALAEEAPSALPEVGLWERGRRYARVRRAGTVAIVVAAVLVLVGITGVTWQQGRPPQPAPAGSAPAVPDRIWDPSPWLDGTDDGRPLGQLAALVPAPRGGLLRSHLGLVGVSATTGDYRFLDLPDLAYEFSITDAALAPDGRHVAYWLTGTPSGSPNPGSGEVPIVGAGIYDTATGEVATYRPEVVHGLSPQTLAWADATHLVIDAGQIAEGAAAPRGTFSATGLGARIWTLGDPGPQPPTTAAAARPVDSVGAGHLLQDVARHTIVVRSVDDPTMATRFRVPGSRGLLVSRAVDASATRFATMGPGSRPTALFAGSIVEGGPGEPRTARPGRLPSSDGTVSVLGWTDRRHVVALHEVTSGSNEMTVVRYAVPTGEADVLMRLAAQESRNSQLATDLLTEPTTPGIEPPRPLDPRLMTFLAVLALGSAGLGIRQLRRRVRA